jgi:acyl dehydratase
MSLYSFDPQPTSALRGRDFMAPITDRYFEDYVPGESYEFGYAVADRDEILRFARRFDPQPIHIDEQFARSGPFGGIIASGWHTSSILMRLFADHVVSKVASLASPGIDDLRWTVPVRPGDQLWLRATTEDARVSSSKPGRGLVRIRCELVNQNDKQAMSLVAMVIFARRPGLG